MHVFRGLPDPLVRRPSAVAIGNFDGVHLGHQSLLEYVRASAAERGLVPSVVTFEPHPKEMFSRGAEIRRISTLYDKVMRILDCGIERIYIVPFHRRFASLTAEEFVRHFLIDGLETCWLCVGEDFRFGSDRRGDVELLGRLARQHAFELCIAPTYVYDDRRVSSTRIREALAKGDLYGTAVMLGHPYTMTGRVIHGAELGRTIGFPTLNLAPIPPGSRARPAIDGVFAVRIQGLGPAVQNGVASLGVKPTVASDGRWLLETHVFDWHGSAYGRIVRVELVERLRGEMKFSGLEELRAAIAADAEHARRILGFPPKDAARL